MGRVSGPGLGGRLLVVELRSGGRVSARVGHRFLQEGRVGFRRDPSDGQVSSVVDFAIPLLRRGAGAFIAIVTGYPYLNPLSSLLLTILLHLTMSSVVLAARHAPIAKPASPCRVDHVGGPIVRGHENVAARSIFVISFPLPPEKTFSRFPIRVLKMRSCAVSSACGEELNSGTNPGNLAKKVNSSTNPRDLAEKVNSCTNSGDLVERVNSGINSGDLAERVNSGTNLGDLAEKVNSGTNPGDLAERSVSESTGRLSEEEFVLVGRLKGILSSLCAIKEMTELWLVKAFLLRGKPRRPHRRGRSMHRLSKLMIRLGDTRRGKEPVAPSEEPDTLVESDEGDAPLVHHRPRSMKDIFKTKVYKSGVGYYTSQVFFLPSSYQLLFCVELPRQAVDRYKESVGFKEGLKRMGRVTYEYEYRVALARFHALLLAPI
ncbi:hypothetical protein B296_00040224 [Ensete ventricosum]|uniref:Uncharacterized protein n=1 Tax=Ensete ventricosum TaxID=4639 RepID=A0A426ZR64_ENSVE|nr:hypothetical protein B296_00040224 [Ensete ventricosum]